MGGCIISRLPGAWCGCLCVRSDSRGYSGGGGCAGVLWRWRALAKTKNFFCITNQLLDSRLLAAIVIVIVKILTQTRGVWGVDMDNGQSDDLCPFYP